MGDPPSWASTTRPEHKTIEALDLKVQGPSNFPPRDAVAPEMVEHLGGLALRSARLLGAASLLRRLDVEAAALPDAHDTDCMEPAEPLSPRYRGHVPKLSTTYPPRFPTMNPTPHTSQHPAGTGYTAVVYPRGREAGSAHRL